MKFSERLGIMGSETNTKEWKTLINYAYISLIMHAQLVLPLLSKHCLVITVPQKCEISLLLINYICITLIHHQAGAKFHSQQESTFLGKVDFTDGRREICRYFQLEKN